MPYPTQQPGLLWPYLNTPNPGTERKHKALLSYSLSRTLDRTNVLGNNDYGHSGCVNALAWAQNGNLLLSAGDDTTVRLWRMDSTDTQNDYPFVCRSVINTGHSQNIFNVAMLPNSNRIVTVAGDRQIRVFDAAAALDIQDGRETEFSARQLSGRVIRCHKSRVKKLVTENSPDIFLTLSEDGTVRQHDLRVRHTCGEDDCAPPLVDTRDSQGDSVELSNISLSPVTPYQFVVAGESPFGYLFDRRQLRRVMEYEWGTVPRLSEGITTCVRRFGRPSPPPSGESRKREDHISGCRMSDANGHEVILSYLHDKIYLFSTLDNPVDDDDMTSSSGSAIVPPNAETDSSPERISGVNEPTFSPLALDSTLEEEDADMREDDDEDDDEDELEELLGGLRRRDSKGLYPGVPVVHPRRSFYGHRSRDTIKDVNFLGPDDEYVVSGSDDGNWFVWQKDTGKLHGIYEGDGSVVNVIEGHPHLPLVCVSGIDTTVKLFSPALGGESKFSRMHKANEIMEANARYKPEPMIRIPLGRLLLQARMMYGSSELEGEEDSDGPRVQCPTQ